MDIILITALFALLLLIFLIGWQADKITEEYSAAIVTQVRKLGLNLEIPNQRPLNYSQQVKIIREAKRNPTIMSMAHIRVLDTRYNRVHWGLVIVCILGLPIIIAFKKVS